MTKGRSCIEFVFIRIWLTGLAQPRQGRKFLAWRRQPQESLPDHENSWPQKGATEWAGLVVSDRKPASALHTFVRRPVGAQVNKVGGLLSISPSPGADAARL
jgi:hypothetical protein